MSAGNARGVVVSRGVHETVHPSRARIDTMPASHPLDDADARQAVIDTVESHGQLADAAQAAGVNIRRLSRYLKTHPEFAEEVAAARRRGEVVAHHAPRMLPANPPMGDPGESITPYDDPCSPAGRARLYEMLWRHADDGSSKGCPKSLDVLAQLGFAPELLAMQAQAKREAAQLEQAGDKSTRPVVIRVPGRKPNSAVIEAELVNPGETRH